MSTHFWARYSSRIELNLEADCDAVIDSCRFPTSATEEGAEDVAARRRDDETMVEIIVWCILLGRSGSSSSEL